MISNTISTGPSPTNGSSQPLNSSSTAASSGGSGSSGFDAAISSSSISEAAATLSSSSPSRSTATQSSAASRFEVYTIPMSAILFAIIAIVSKPIAPKDSSAARSSHPLNPICRVLIISYHSASPGYGRLYFIPSNKSLPKLGFLSRLKTLLHHISPWLDILQLLKFN